MEICEFTRIVNAIIDPESGHKWKFICVWCGRIAFDEESKKEFSCTGERTPILSGPPLAVKAFNLAESYLEHVTSGRKTCTDAQIASRFEHCVSCDKYNKLPDPHGSCTECGCYVNTIHAKEGLNKLSWAEQECPHPLGPKWISVL